MNCREYADAIVDLARGAEIGDALRDGVTAHVSSCESCRLRLARERSLTAGLDALSKSVAGARPSAALESRLLAAFAEATAVSAETSAAAKPPATRGASVGSRWRWAGLAAAAALMLAVIPAWLLEPPTRPGPPPPKKTAAVEPPPAVDPPAVAVADTPPISGAANAGSRRSARKTSTLDRIVRPSGFVALPTAAGLPEFESGVIERVDLSLASLPTYGIQIPPDAAQNPLPAEILVGQDGFARAIRFMRVTATTTPTMRSTQ